jgi:excisionase family DNA binding protein
MNTLEIEIRRIAQEVVREAIFQVSKPKEIPQKIGVDEAARLLGRSKQTIHRWTCYRYKDLPFEKKGSRIMFDLEALKAWARPLGMINN